MKSVWVVLVCVVLASTAFAQIPVGLSPRALGMGMAGIGVADDASAWFQNPAGLAALNVPVQEGETWGHDLSASYADIVDVVDTWRVSWSGWEPEGNVGVGAGYLNINTPGPTVVGLGAGVGKGIGNSPFSLGLNVVQLQTPGPNFTLLNGGAMFRIGQGDKDPIRIGVTAVDLTDEFNAGVFLNAGVAWPILDGLLVAVDVIDLTEQISGIGMHANGGLEYRFGSSDEWAARVGVVDFGFSGIDPLITAGLGFGHNRWRVDGAWMEAPASGLSSTWTVGAGICF